MSDNTVLAYSKDIRAFLESCDGYVSEQDFESCAAYWIQVARKTWSPATVSRRLCSLKSFAKWAHMPNTLDDYKMPPAVKTAPHPLPEGTPGVVRMIEATDNLSHRSLVALCGLVGLRIAEALTVTASSIDPHSLQLTIVGKGFKQRRVPVSDLAWSILDEPYCRSVLTGDRALVQSGHRAARRAVTSLGRRARLSRRVASHDLRATFATNLMDLGVNIRIIQELLGHSSIVTTEAYLGITDKAKREAVNL